MHPLSSLFLVKYEKLQFCDVLAIFSPIKGKQRQSYIKSCFQVSDFQETGIHYRVMHIAGETQTSQDSSVFLAAQSVFNFSFTVRIVD